MSTATQSDPQIRTVTVTDNVIVAHLTDGRTISVPLAWSWRLSDASSKQRARWEIIAEGHGIHWPEVDEDISLEGMLHGIPARRPRHSAARRVNRQKRDVESELLRIVDRADYQFYFNQAAMLPSEPVTYRP